MATTLYYTNILTPVETIERGALVISDDGKIAYVGTTENAPQVAGKKIDLRGRYVVPGFIDVHTHADNIAEHPLAELQRAAEEPAEASGTKAVAAADTNASAETIVITSLNYQGGVAVIRFTGSPTRDYILQAKDSLEAGSWSNIGTNQASVGHARPDGLSYLGVRFGQGLGCGRRADGTDGSGGSRSHGNIGVEQRHQCWKALNVTAVSQ